MAGLLALLRPLQAVNDLILAFGRRFATVAIGLMVCAILFQVFMRYALNNAQPWPEELALFLMLWMTGLIAPLAYRRGGFVAIDMVTALLPRRAAAVLTLGLLLLSLSVLVKAAQLGHTHVFSGCLFKSSTLWVPFTFSFNLPLPLTDLSLTLCTRQPGIGLEWGWVKMPLAISFLSLWVGILLLISVNVELILRSLVTYLGGEDRLRPILEEIPVGAD